MSITGDSGWRVAPTFGHHLEHRWTMSARSLIQAICQRTPNWVWSVAEAFPPYQVAQGIVEHKDVEGGGKLFVQVNGTRVAVDQPTFELLSTGYHVRIRYTRRARAISIDLYHSENRHE